MSSFEGFLDSASSDSHLRIEADLGDGFVRLRSDEADKRQAAQDIRSTEDIILELLRNARDAHAHSVYIAVSTSGSTRSICIIDDGDGIPQGLHEIIFEPRVTSKLDTAHKDTWGYHGRGMALYSVRLNSLEAKICCSAPTLGSSIFVLTDLNSLPEKADQSTFPSLKIESDNSITVRGPRNILRTACEFALQERKSIKVYVGSPAEISATILHNAFQDIPFALRAFNADLNDVSFVHRPAYCSDARDLSLSLSSMGLDISVRTAQRIINSEINILENLIERIAKEGISAKNRDSVRHSKSNDINRIAIKPDFHDFEMIKRSLSDPIETLEEKYYLKCGNEIDIKINRGSIKITIPIIPSD